MCACGLLILLHHGFAIKMTSERQTVEEDYLPKVKKLPESRAINPEKSPTMEKLKVGCSGKSNFEWEFFPVDFLTCGCANIAMLHTQTKFFLVV